MPEDIYSELNILRDFLFRNVYTTPTLGNQRSKIKGVLQAIFEHIKEYPDTYIQPYPSDDPQDRRVIDFIAGMTDNYALKLFKTIAIPRYVY